MALPKCELVHGLEKQFFVNHVGHFMLITELLDRLTKDGRVVLVSSDLHKNAPRSRGVDFDILHCNKKYEPLQSYTISKFANVTFAKTLARKFQHTDRKAFAVHPGVIPTNLLRHQNVALRAMFSFFGRFLFRNVGQGASSQVFAVCHPDASAPNTSYLVDCR